MENEHSAVKRWSICLGVTRNKYQLGWKHSFWRKWIATHFLFQMKSKPLRYSCPDWGNQIDNNMVKLLLSKEEQKKSEMFELQDKVDQDPNLYWCPRPNWGKYVNKLEGNKSKPSNIEEKNYQNMLECEWGFRFWANWHEQWHEGISCAKMKDKGIRRLRIQAVLQKWPTCGWLIEKNQGWSSMICTLWGMAFNWNPNTQEAREEELEARDPLHIYLDKHFWRLGVLIIITMMALLFWSTICVDDPLEIKKNWKGTNLTTWIFLCIVRLEFLALKFHYFLIYS